MSDIHNASTQEAEAWGSLRLAWDIVRASLEDQTETIRSVKPSLSPFLNGSASPEAPDSGQDAV